MNWMGPLGGTKAGKPRTKIGGRNLTDTTRDMADRIKPSNKR